MSKQKVELLPTTYSVTDGIKAIDKQIASLKHIQDSVYVTSARISAYGGTIDIKEEKSQLELVRAFGSILTRAKSIEDAYNELGLTTYPTVKIEGFTVEEWKKDIQLRIAIIEQKDTLDELTSIKKEWEDLMDKEDRKSLLIEKMAKLINK